MIPYAFAFLLLVISTIAYCMYSAICYHRRKKIDYIEENSIDDMISRVTQSREWESDHSVRIKQMWKDYKGIEQVYSEEWTPFAYIFTVLITIGTIVTYTIKEFNGSEKGAWDIVGIVWRICLPTIVCLVIWVILLHWKKSYKSFQSVKDLKHECEDNHFYGAEKAIQTIVNEELDMKSKQSSRSSAVMILLLIAALTLASSFFEKDEYEIEEEQSRIEESYQAGYNDGYEDGYSDGGGE